MAKQVINVGTVANDGTGDFLKPAMVKVNENFSELYDHNDSLSTVAYSGNYDDLNNLPTPNSFDGNYNSLTGLPTLGTASAENIEFFALAEEAVPPGGLTGQVLAKASDTSNDVEWVEAGDIGTGVPDGGTTGQVLVKNSGTDGDASWSTLDLGIQELEDDLTPTLGGPLDRGAFEIIDMVIGTDIQPYDDILTNTTASFTTDLETKLNALPTNATLESALALKADITYVDAIVGDIEDALDAILGP
jgi:hypothetical protein